MSKVEVTVKPFEQDFIPIEMTIKFLDKDSAIAFWQRMYLSDREVMKCCRGSRFSSLYETDESLWCPINEALASQGILKD